MNLNRGMWFLGTVLVIMFAYHATEFGFWGMVVFFGFLLCFVMSLWPNGIDYVLNRRNKKDE
ncbi:MAG: hypothetical protein KDA87_05980 [Planctomycetales bacterium]|nr:hypothetical protein [Planctomycetales bacterium]